MGSPRITLHSLHLPSVHKRSQRIKVMFGHFYSRFSVGLCPAYILVILPIISWEQLMTSGKNLCQWKAHVSSNQTDWHLRFPQQMQRINIANFPFSYSNFRLVIKKINSEYSLEIFTLLNHPVFIFLHTIYFAVVSSQGTKNITS